LLACRPAEQANAGPQCIKPDEWKFVSADRCELKKLFGFDRTGKTVIAGCLLGLSYQII
jgi:hypothetical protein